MEEPDASGRANRLHGRRAGRPLRAGQRDRLERLLPIVAVDVQRLPDDGVATAFAHAVDEVRLEIGFGGGEHLATEAERHPRIGFIGCEPFRNGVAKMLEAIELRSLSNIRIHAGDAVDLIERLPGASIARIDLLYPDPWPKRRHRDRRFISDANLDRLARVLRPGGALRFATDIDDYAGWTLARVLRSRSFVWTAETAADWRTPWPSWPSTRYERKALAAHRRPVYLTFVRQPAA